MKRQLFLSCSDLSKTRKPPTASETQSRKKKDKTNTDLNKPDVKQILYNVSYGGRLLKNCHTQEVHQSLIAGTWNLTLNTTQFLFVSRLWKLCRECYPTGSNYLLQEWQHMLMCRVWQSNTTSCRTPSASNLSKADIIVKKIPYSREIGIWWICCTVIGSFNLSKAGITL